VKGIWSAEGIEYFQEQGLKRHTWSEVKGFWSMGKSIIYGAKVTKVLSKVKWSEGNLKYGGNQIFPRTGLEFDKWSEGILKWGENQLNAEKEKELRQGEFWSVYKGSKVEWGVRVGEMCVTEYCIEWFTHCLVYLVVFNTDSCILGSTCFWVLIVYDMCSWFFLVILWFECCLECCMVICAMCDVYYSIVLSYLAL